MNNDSRLESTRPYAEQASTLIARYESISFEEAHRDELHLLPMSPSRVLDIGAGSGRDAGWFAAHGHRVLAVEPTLEMRMAASSLHPLPSIEWVDDALPNLSTVLSRGESFDVIMISAVWMHLDEEERRAAMPNIASLLSRDGILFLSLRHGPIPPGRRLFEVTGNETIALACQSGLSTVLNLQTPSIQAANLADGVTWTKLGFVAER